MGVVIVLQKQLKILLPPSSTNNTGDNNSSTGNSVNPSCSNKNSYNNSTENSYVFQGSPDVYHSGFDTSYYYDH